MCLLIVHAHFPKLLFFLFEEFYFLLESSCAGGGVVKLLSPAWETWVQSLSREDPLEKGMAAHARILAWRGPWTEEPGGPQSMGSQRVGHG